MSLVQCLECKKEVSDKATVCPHCGNPTIPQVSQPIVQAETKITSVEYTSKKIKRDIAIAVSILILGLILIIAGMANIASGKSKGGLMAFGVFIFFVGIFDAILVKISRWWHHG